MLLTSLLLPVVVITVIGAAGVLPAPARARVRRVASVLAPAAVLPAAAVAIGGADPELSLPWLLFGVTFAVDGLGRVLVLVSALLYGAALIAVAWLRSADREPRAAFLSAFLMSCYVGNIGVYLAADTVAFYLSFAVMSFSAVGLVIHHRTRQAHRATIVYLIMSVVSETSLLVGMLLVFQAGGARLADAPQAVLDSGHTGLILVLLFLGFGIKAGTAPLHVWLPLAHPAAPPAASAVLSGAMVKAGVVGWLRFFPPAVDGAAGQPVETFAWVLLLLSLAGAFLAALLGVVQNDLKVILAYSTISQLGFIGAVVAAGMLVPEARSAAAAAVVLYAAHHGFAKGALFLGVPVVQRFGRGPWRVVTLVGLFWAALALVGAPWTSGAYAKYVAKDAAAGVSLWGAGLDALLPFVATGSTLLLARLAWVAWSGQRSATRVPDGELAGWVLLCLAGLTVPWWVGDAWLQLTVPDWNAATIWGMVWPILTGLVPAGIVGWLVARHRLPTWVPAADGSWVAPGDLVVAGEHWAGWVRERGGPLLERLTDRTRQGAQRLRSAGSDGTERAQRAVSAGEARVSRWSGTGALLLGLLGLSLVWLLLAGGGS